MRRGFLHVSTRNGATLFKQDKFSLKMMFLGQQLNAGIADAVTPPVRMFDAFVTEVAD